MNWLLNAYNKTKYDAPTAKYLHALGDVLLYVLVNYSLLPQRQRYHQQQHGGYDRSYLHHRRHPANGVVKHDRSTPSSGQRRC